MVISFSTSLSRPFNRERTGYLTNGAGISG
jgi:hypothetical protein